VADILVVEDESVIRCALKRLLERNKFRVCEAASVREAEENFKLERFSLIISDLRLPGAPGTELIRRAGEVPVLIMTSYASLRSAVDAMRMGAVDYIAKPFDHEDLLATIKRILRERSAQRLARGKDAARPTAESVTGMIGSCPAVLEVHERIRRVAPTSTSVLIHGETGTGKELVARAIHRASKRAAQPLVSVNCAAIPEALIESELFGFDKGAGGHGIIEAASGGTLFLDEIGELPPEVQARLLRFIQSGEVRSGGAPGTHSVDVRLISATQRNLKALCEEGKFRQDLYYRINVVELSLPPLRERGGDVLQIAAFLLEDACRRHEKPAKHFSPEAIQAISTYRWPGNVRELENAIERAVILCDAREISHQSLALDVQPSAAADAGDSSGATREKASENEDPAEDLSLEEYFQRFVLQNQNHMSETELARKLGVSRKCLWERRQRFGIPRKKTAAEEDDSGRRSA
jgi:DNA-binding NtrC family response regulator